jgi:predicted RNase H-like nuclease (RuvC/YqgF family)
MSSMEETNVGGETDINRGCKCGRHNEDEIEELTRQIRDLEIQCKACTEECKSLRHDLARAHHEYAKKEKTLKESVHQRSCCTSARI